MIQEFRNYVQICAFNLRLKMICLIRINTYSLYTSSNNIKIFMLILRDEFKIRMQIIGIF